MNRVQTEKSGSLPLHPPQKPRITFNIVERLEQTGFILGMNDFGKPLIARAILLIGSRQQEALRLGRRPWGEDIDML